MSKRYPRSSRLRAHAVFEETAARFEGLASREEANGKCEIKFVRRRFYFREKWRRESRCDTRGSGFGLSQYTSVILL